MSKILKLFQVWGNKRAESETYSSSSQEKKVNKKEKKSNKHYKVAYDVNKELRRMSGK